MEDGHDTLRAMLVENLVSENNKNGLLTPLKEKECFACFTLDIVKLKQLFGKVKTHWQSNLTKTEKRAAEV